MLGIKADTVLGVGVGDGPLELALNVFRLFHQEDTALGYGFAHFTVRSVETHNSGASFRDIGFRNFEHIAVDTIETLGDVSGQLTVLLLIVPHGDKVRLVEQNVSGHQCGIGEQTAVDILRMLCGLILKLGHPAQFTKHGMAIQNPPKLRVLMDMALNEQCIFLRVQAAGNILCQLFQCTAAQICRGLADGNGVKVCHEVEAVKLLGTGTPVFNGS